MISLMVSRRLGCVSLSSPICAIATGVVLCLVIYRWVLASPWMLALAV
jgi:hypothetical protein